MIAFFTQYGGTLLVGAILVIIVAAIVIKLVRDKKKGRTSCGCGCSGCANSANCHAAPHGKA